MHSVPHLFDVSLIKSIELAIGEIAVICRVVKYFKYMYFKYLFEIHAMYFVFCI